MYFDPMYFLFIAPAFIFSLWASWRTKANFKKYSKVPVSSGMSGAEAAQRILDGAGIRDVSIGRSRGLLSDHYNPVKKNLALSDGVYRLPLPGCCRHRRPRSGPRDPARQGLRSAQAAVDARADRQHRLQPGLYRDADGSLLRLPEHGDGGGGPLFGGARCSRS